VTIDESEAMLEATTVLEEMSVTAVTIDEPEATPEATTVAEELSETERQLNVLISIESTFRKQEQNEDSVRGKKRNQSRRLRRQATKARLAREAA
jgi:hypothetical protein